MKQKTGDSEKEAPPVGSEVEVVRFFLNLYRLQLGCPAAGNIRTAARRLDEKAESGEKTYELIVLDQTRTEKRRRMTIAALGENSGSKSICYKVTYDDLIVVKIPPRPITDFEEYIENIYGERRTADQLAPEVECIAPSLSALLRRIPGLTPDADCPMDRIELFYMEKLRKSPWLQDHLKIGGTFVFFMSLSRYSFLGHVIEKMHGLEKQFYEEIFTQFDILWNLMAFESVYGPEYSPVFFKINEIYTEYEERVNILLKKNRLNAALFVYKRKEWFQLYLAQKKPDTREKNLPREFLYNLELLFMAMDAARKEDVDTYRRMVRDHVRKKVYEQNRAQFKGIVINILNLLYWLKVKGVAVRDLKPDNIFVVGGDFLQAANEFSLGLIDFETAVNFSVKDDEISQPLLAGTPAYATPSHLARNPVIRESLGSLSRVLHLQDWQAALGMIFYVVTGERLFDRTRRWLGETWKNFQQASARNISPSAAFRKSSQLFWLSAFREFCEKLAGYEQALKGSDIVPPDNIREMLRIEASENRANIFKTLQQMIRSQNIFKSDKARLDLLRSSIPLINRCRRNWEDGVNVPEAQPEIRTEIIRFLRQVEYLKTEAEKRLGMVRLLQKNYTAISIYDLLELMLDIILGVMYRNEWGILRFAAEPPSVAAPSRNGGMPDVTIAYEDTVTPEETISYEKTISYDNKDSHDETISYTE